MSEVQLYEGFVGPWGSENRAGAIVLGTPFTLTQDYYVLRFRWYRLSPGSGYAYTKMALYDSACNVVVAAFDAPDNGGAGWQEHTLPSSVLLHSGTTYWVAALCPAGTNVAYAATASRPSPPAGVSWPAGDVRKYTASSTMACPSNGDNSEFYAIDVSLSTSPLGGSGGSGVATLTGDLAAWLSADTENQEHQTDGLPWLTKQDTSAIATIVNNIPQATDTPWVTAGKLWQIAGALTDLEITAWNAFAKRAPNQLTGATGGGGSAFFAGDGRQVAQSAATAVDNTALLLALRRNALATFPGIPWVMADETAFTGPLVYGQEADAYVVHTTTIPPNRPSTLGDGAPWTPRLGWWAVRSGTIFGERHFFDFPSSILGDGSLRMPGVLIWPEDGASGTIQAWVYS